MEIEVTGPNKELHSGLYGGAVANPANVLARLIAALTDEEAASRSRTFTIPCAN
ncbi:MAG: peptidase dimerization domain-containing protein [Alistipes indistinctus]